MLSGGSDCNRVGRKPSLLLYGACDGTIEMVYFFITMTPAGLLALIRAQTWVWAGNISDATMTIYVNLAYKKIINAITARFWQKFFSYVSYASLVAWQTDYAAWWLVEDDIFLKKIHRVEIKNSDNDTYYALVDKNTLENFQTLSSDRISAGAVRWMREIVWSALRIYPAPLNSVTDWLAIFLTYSLQDLVLSSTSETDIFEWSYYFSDYHEIIATGTYPYIARHQNIKDQNDIRILDDTFRRDLDDMLNAISPDSNEPSDQSRPNLDCFVE